MLRLLDYTTPLEKWAIYINSQMEKRARLAPANPENALDQPLVSIICFCKDSATTIRRSIESVLNQTYRNIEFVVQDGVSTDGTLEILKGYGDPRIKLVSEPDSGPADAFWKVLNRCRGDIIGTCLSDEELLPGAIGRAVEVFRQHPGLGAATFDGYVTDADGRVTGEFIAGEFNLVDYLFGRYCPLWPGSFLRRQALRDVGLGTDQWTIGCLEFEIWLRLGTRHSVKYFNEYMAKYAVHATQLSNTPKHWSEHLAHRVKLIEQMFSDEGFAGPDTIKRIACLFNQHFLFYNHARAYKFHEHMEAIYHRMMGLLEQLGPLERAEYGANYLLGDTDRAQIQGRVLLLWQRFVGLVPGRINRLLPRKFKNRAREVGMQALYWLFSYRLPRDAKEAKQAVYGVSAPLIPPTLYRDFANLYYGRGQIGQALEMWERARALNDPMVDGLASQAMLLLPGATYAGLLDIQARWVAKHVGAPKLVSNPIVRQSPGERKIRVGYYCSFMEGDTIRFMMSPVIKRHDRSKFTVFGYSPNSLPQDMARTFDAVRSTRGLSDEQFAELVRSDEVDIFVEMSGLSPYNRFAAMALRCAPIQISYLNHTGTSAVPNVDYTLADEVGVLPEEDRYFTEKVWRLPDCFFCFNYEMTVLPPVAERPSRGRGYVTFGCFGSGGKINDELIARWSKILAQVPASRIYLRNQQLTPMDNQRFMLERFRRHGIAADRVRLGVGGTRDEIVRSYDEVDITLDTWPYCGGNTVAESLWQGVPVVTLKGDRFSSRYGASLVIAAGCGELVGETEERYIEIAAGLAGSPERLDHYRQNLRTMAMANGLSDAERFARKLERAYGSMIDEHSRN